MTVNINAANISSVQLAAAQTPSAPNSGFVRLHHNANSRLAMRPATGNVVEFLGNTSGSGAGITFPATQSPSSDANTLDDYSEGTWTPSLGRLTTGFTMTQTRSGRYIKIGNMVTLWGTINITAVSAQGSNFWALFGLPYPLGTERGIVGSAGNPYSTTAITTSTVMMHIIAPTSGNYLMFRNTTGAYVNENAQAGTLTFSVVYDVS